MLEWSSQMTGTARTSTLVKDANPASWITLEGLAEQREAVADIAFRRFHCNVGRGGSALATDRRVAGVRRPDREDPADERICVGVDVGGERSASAVVWVTEDLRVDCRVFHGDRAVLESPTWCASSPRHSRSPR